jgi:hypothetical protein
MSSPARIGVFLVLVAAPGLSACGADVPANPTWANDVRPLMVARCIRCHDTTQRGDPLSLSGAVALDSFNYENFTDIPGPVVTLLQMQVGLVSLDTSSRMPPPPAAKLQDWQIETLQHWCNHPM